MSLTLKTLLVAHATEFNTVTFLPSNKPNSASRPENSFHFIDSKQPIDFELALLLQDEAGAQGDVEIKTENSIGGVDYLIVSFYVSDAKDISKAA